MPLSDIVFLDGNEPEEVIYGEDAYEKGLWFQAKNMDMIILSQLGSMLGVSSYDELMSGFSPIVEPEPEGPFLLSIPGMLQEKLRGITDEEISSVVPKWAQIEELSGGDISVLTEYLTRLREFLTQKSESAYLCLSL